MKTVGHRRTPHITVSASGHALAEGARFNDEMQRLPIGGSTFFPKGVYRYATHAEASAHWLTCLANGIARAARERDKWKNTAARRHSKT